MTIITVTNNSGARDQRTGQFLPQSTLERFWAKVDRGEPDECWEWQASKDNQGYGMFWYQDKTQHAHRVLWILLHGPLSKSVHVCHECDNPACCNPAHLWPGSAKQNVHDKFSKGRAVPPPPPRFRGEKHPGSKLTDEEVKEICALYRPNAKGLIKNLATRFGVTPKTIWAIATGRGRTITS